MPGLFLDYRGPVDYGVIDSLLLKLKNTREFTELGTLIRKRTYSLIVECIENICKHSALTWSADKSVQPHIIVKNEENRIHILAGNPVAADKCDSIRQKLDEINNMTVQELMKIHELRLNHKSVPGENGAGLGFIYIAYKSGNKLIYSFNPLISGFFYFEIEISLNK